MREKLSPPFKKKEVGFFIVFKTVFKQSLKKTKLGLESC